MKKTEIGRYDGLFVPESRLMAIVHRTLARRRVRRFPQMVACNMAAECFAGLYPRPAYIDFDANMVAQLALEQLLEMLSGAPGTDGRVSVMVNPILVPGD